jgi:acetylornithine deacetylase/succinyl-diaminopimelate desuccinylase-like protein
VRKTLVDVIADPKVSVTYVTNGMKVIANDPGNKSLPPVPLKPEVMVPLEKIAAQMWPGAPVVPTMSTGASDGVYTNAAGMPTYGVCGLAIDIDDQRAHGRDERLGVQSYYTGVDFYYRYLKALTAAR